MTDLVVWPCLHIIAGKAQGLILQAKPCRAKGKRKGNLVIIWIEG